MAQRYLLQVKNLKIALRVDDNFIPIVDGVDLSLEPGKVLGLVGESGCGKSVTALSLLRLLSKELKIVDGKILFYGQILQGFIIQFLEKSFATKKISICGLFKPVP